MFAARLASPRTRIAVAEVSGAPVGYVYFETHAPFKEADRSGVGRPGVHGDLADALCRSMLCDDAQEGTGHSLSLHRFGHTEMMDVDATPCGIECGLGKRLGPYL